MHCTLSYILCLILFQHPLALAKFDLKLGIVGTHGHKASRISRRVKEFYVPEVITQARQGQLWQWIFVIASAVFTLGTSYFTKLIMTRCNVNLLFFLRGPTRLAHTTNPVVKIHEINCEEALLREYSDCDGWRWASATSSHLPNIRKKTRWNKENRYVWHNRQKERRGSTLYVRAYSIPPSFSGSTNARLRLLTALQLSGTASNNFPVYRPCTKIEYPRFKE